jgi:hypothetical protein
MKRQNPWRNRRPVAAPGFDPETQWQFASRWFKRALKASTFVGMLIVMFYFLSLRAMPVDSLSSIGQLVAPVAFAAILFFLLLFFYWGVPAWLVKILFIDGNWNQTTLLPWITAGISGGRSLGRTSTPRFADYFVFALKWNFCTFGLWWFAIFSLAMPDHLLGSTSNIILTVLFIVLSGSLLYRWFVAHNKTALTSENVISSGIGVTWHRWLCLGLACGVMTIAPVVAMVMLSVISPLGQDDNLISFWSPLAGICAFAIFSNAGAFANMLHDHSGRQKNKALTVVISASIVLLALAGMLVGLSGQAWMNSVMNALSVRIPNATLQLNQAGCESLTQLGVQVDHGSAQAPSPICKISKVVVFSRVGSYWLIGCEPPHIPIDKKAQPATTPEKRRWLQASFVQGIEQQQSDKNSGHQLPTGAYCP